MPAYFAPEQFASMQLDKDILGAFVENNIASVVYAPMPSRGVDDNTREFYKKNKRCEVSCDGLTVVRRFSLIKEGRNPVLRAMRYFMQCFKQLLFGIFSREAKSCDVIYVDSTPPIQGAMAAIIKKFTKKPIVYSLQDIFPDSLVGTNMAQRNGLLWKIGRAIENFTYRNADQIIVISEDFKRNIMAKGVPEDKIHVIYTWVDENQIYPVDKKDNPLYEEFSIDKEKFTVVYAGNLGHAQNLDIIIEAAKVMRTNDNVQFLIFGSGGLEDSIRKSIADDSLCNVKQLPLQSYDRVSYVYGLGDVCIVSCKPGQGGSAMPSKTWSIMSCGRAVLASFDEGDLKNIVEKHNCGVFTKAGDLDDFVSTLNELSVNYGKCVNMGENARQFIVRNLTKEAGTSKIVEVIRSVIV